MDTQMVKLKKRLFEKKVLEEKNKSTIVFDFFTFFTERIRKTQKRVLIHSS